MENLDEKIRKICESAGMVIGIVGICSYETYRTYDYQGLSEENPILTGFKVVGASVAGIFAGKLVGMGISYLRNRKKLS